MREDYKDLGDEVRRLRDELADELPLEPPPPSISPTHNDTSPARAFGAVTDVTAPMGAAPDAAPDLADVLDRLVGFLRGWVVFGGEEAPDAVALWVAHTYIIDEFDCTPYLAITSPEKRSGKSRLLDVLELLTHAPEKIMAPSPAVVFRMISADHPTLLWDETDTVFGPRAAPGSEDLRALLNGGYRRGTTVPRCVGEGAKMAVQRFDVYCPKALAGIGRLPDTVTDRAITVRLRRRQRTEPIQRFRFRDAMEATRAVTADLEAWAETAALREARPRLPDDLDDRAQDCWEPLLAIADAAAGDWPERAHIAALALSAGHVDGDEGSLGVRLLSDLRDVFAETGEARMSTALLIERLCAIDEAPWGDWYGKAITRERVAKLLRPYGVRSQEWHDAGAHHRGYRKGDFEDAWARYTAFNPGHPGKPPICRENATLQLGIDEDGIPG